MVTVTATQGFDSNDFWAPQTNPLLGVLNGPNLGGLYSYRYQSAAGYVEVTGTNLSVSLLGIPLFGQYTDIRVYSDAGYTQEIAHLHSDTDIPFISYFLTPTANNYAGNDMLSGSSAADVLTSYDGNDTLVGGGGADQLDGGFGDDAYYVDDASAAITDAGGSDTLYTSGIASVDLTSASLSGIDNVVLQGGLHLNATGNGGVNQLTGNAGNNLLDGGAGADTMAGGAGDDIYVIDNAGDTVAEALGQGYDTVRGFITTFAGANVEAIELLGLAAINAIGNELNNTLTGNAAANTLNGRAGADTMAGGAGDDTYYIDNAGDLVTEAQGQGYDTLWSFISTTAGANVDAIQLQGTADLNATGNTLNNYLKGNAGANTLDGLAGADTMAGGAGNDLYYVDNAGDVVNENVGEGFDTVRSTVTVTLRPNIEAVELIGSAAANAVGNTLDNTMTGNSAINLLNGGAGDDTMSGGDGDDTYVVDGAGDIVTETNATAFGGYDTVLSYVSFTAGANIESVRLVGTASVNASGNALNNVLVGNAGVNTLSGGAGSDILKGVGGNDILIGGDGDDVYLITEAGNVVTENAAPSGGYDTVSSFISAAAGVGIESVQLRGIANVDATGNALDNYLAGNAGNNVITGGLGLDIMRGLGGNDTFVFQSINDSSALTINADRIFDFSVGDKIDLGAIDANSSIAGNQAFVLDADQSFSAGEYRVLDVGTDLVVQLNVDGGAADMAIIVKNFAQLSAGDFIL